MSYSIISTHRFSKELKRLVKKFPSLKSEFGDLINKINQEPKIGNFIGNNCYKIRLAITSKRKGKSGGARIITYLHLNSETAYLLTIYDKGEKEDLKPNEIGEMIDSLELEIL
jgi:mRNA-degrading endonuclease RelE of RelBE toxin-antitoxin system